MQVNNAISFLASESPLVWLQDLVSRMEDPYARTPYLVLRASYSYLLVPTRTVPYRTVLHCNVLEVTGHIKRDLFWVVHVKSLQARVGNGPSRVALRRTEPPGILRPLARALSHQAGERICIFTEYCTVPCLEEWNALHQLQVLYCNYGSDITVLFE